MQGTGSSSMSWLAVIALVIAAMIALAYMITSMPGAPYAPATPPGDSDSEAFAEEQDLQAMELNGLDQGLQDIGMELAK